MTGILRFTGLLGMIVFGGLFFVLLQYPKAFERTAVGFVKQRIEVEIRERFPELGAGGLAEGARKLSERIGLGQELLQKRIDDGLPELIAEVVAGHCGCAAKHVYADIVRNHMTALIARLGQSREQLAEIIKGKYDTILAGLRRDLMIFLGSNFVAFAAVFTTTLLRGEASRLTVWPASLLVIASVVSSGLYLFDQNWFYTILFKDYAGYSYAVGMALIFALLLDIVMNRGRITIRIVTNIPFAPPC